MNVSEQIYKNVKALAAINGMDMKAVEEKIGKSAGYLSRKNRKISVDMLMDLSEIFEEPVDDLIHKDFEHELKQKTLLENLDIAFQTACEIFNPEALIARLEAKKDG